MRKRHTVKNEVRSTLTKKKLRSHIRKQKRKKSIVKKTTHKLSSLILLFLLLNFGFFSVAGVFTLDYLQSRNSEIPTPDKVFPEVGLATEIYDRNGEKLYRLYGDDSNNDKLNIDEITPVIKATLLAAEDDSYYNHNGFDLRAITRCAIIISKNDGLCGGSTITQQLIKITTQQKERNIEAKVDEILLAHKVEEMFSKDQILEMYLRVTPYGSNVTGFKTAAKAYFGVEDLSKLTLAQSAILVSIINNPANLSPTMSLDNTTSQQKLKERQMYVLDQLSLKLDYINQQLLKNDPNAEIITQEMITVAKSEEISYLPAPTVDIKAGHFVNYTITKLQQGNYNNGKPFTLQELKTGGYKIYTSLDYKAQQIAERYVWDAGNNFKWARMHNAAVMTTVPSTGEIVTMAGSKSFDAPSEGCDANGQNCLFDPQVNVLTSLQSPGSTNKSMGYYIAYANRKLYPWSKLKDEPMSFGGYRPKNWDGRFLGDKITSAKEMLRLSRNIPAVKVITMIGVPSYLKTAREFGYTTYKDDSQYGPSVILGGTDIYLDEHAQGYGVFANGGDLVKLNPIKKIVDSDGNVVYEAQPTRKRVADPYGVSLLNQSLYRLDGVNTPIYWDGRDIAGKTGTTEENKDVLLVIYSPDFVTVAWGGNNNNAPLNTNYGWPGFLLNPWVRGYMSDLGGIDWFNQRSKFNW